MTDEVVGKIIMTTSETVIKGNRYVVSIAFDGKPDFSKIIADMHSQHYPKVPLSEDLWDYTLRYELGQDYTSFNIWHVSDPAKKHPDDMLLTAITKVDAENGIVHNWYRVQIRIFSDTDMDAESFEGELRDSLQAAFGKPENFVHVKKVSKFPGEGKVTDRKVIPITKSMLDKWEKE